MRKLVSVYQATGNQTQDDYFIIYIFHNNHPATELVFILSHIFTPRSFKIHFNIILKFTYNIWVLKSIIELSY